MREELFDLLFLDFSFSSENSLDVLREIKGLHLDCSVVTITGAPHSRTITRARQFGALDYLVKPIRQASLLYVARKVLSEKAPQSSEIRFDAKPITKL